MRFNTLGWEVSDQRIVWIGRWYEHITCDKWYEHITCWNRDTTLFSFRWSFGDEYLEIWLSHVPLVDTFCHRFNSSTKHACKSWKSPAKQSSKQFFKQVFKVHWRQHVESQWYFGCSMPGAYVACCLSWNAACSGGRCGVW